MSKRTKAPQAPAHDAVAEMDGKVIAAQAALDGLTQRDAQLAHEARQLEKDAREASDAIDEALATGEPEPDGLRGVSCGLRERVADITRARGRLAAKIKVAEGVVEATRKARGRALYVAAREREDAAGKEFERVVREAFLPALVAYRTAGREAYGHGLSAGIETNTHYMRRTRTIVQFLNTQLSQFYPRDFGIRNVERVDGLTDRVDRVVPGVPEQVEAVA
jgi:hypothetical protein